MFLRRAGVVVINRAEKREIRIFMTIFTKLTPLPEYSMVENLSKDKKTHSREWV
jgi:hypothetical protein